MRLVKRSVNQDDPGTYHLFYADAEGHPGTDLTFFPWAQMAPPRLGHGLAIEVGLEVPAGQPRLLGRAAASDYGVAHRRRRDALRRRACCRSSIRTGCAWRWSKRAAPARAPFTPWDGSPVPAERQIRGLYGAQLWERDAAPTRPLPDHACSGFSELGTRERLDALRLHAAPPASSTSARRRDERARRVGRRQRAPSGVARWTTTTHQLAVRAQVEQPARHADAGDRSLLVQVGLLQGAGRRAVRAGDRRPRLRGRRGSGAPRRDAGAAAVARSAARRDRAARCRR